MEDAETMSKVFDVELLRETILYHTIRDYGGRHMLKEHICACRLVSKAWNESVSRILLQSRRALLSVRLNPDHLMTTRGHEVQENGKLLFNKFLMTVVGHHSLTQRVPPFSMVVGRDFISEEKNHINLFCFWTKFGTGLIDLKLSFPPYVKLMPLEPNTSLSRLRLFSITIVPTGDNMKVWTNLMQSVFDVCEQLESFQIVRRMNPGFMNLDNLSSLVIPSSLKSIDWKCSLTDNNLGVLAKNRLSNLKILKLSGKQLAVNGNIISCILENVKGTLVEFHLEGIRRFVEDLVSSKFKLPLMEKLTTIKFENVAFELKQEHPLLQQLVPVLDDLSLVLQTPQMFRKWTYKSRYESVTSMKVSWRDCSVRNVGLSEDLQIYQVESLAKSFPNLQNLNITLDDDDGLSDVSVIWRELRKLKHLKICADNSDAIRSSDVWDALFIGVSEDQVAALKRNPDLWDSLQHEASPSIRDLTELYTLELDSRTGQHATFPLVSEATIQFAFLKMPKLWELRMNGGFSVRFHNHSNKQAQARHWKCLGYGHHTGSHLLVHCAGEY